MLFDRQDYKNSTCDLSSLPSLSLTQITEANNLYASLDTEKAVEGEQSLAWMHLHVFLNQWSFCDQTKTVVVLFPESSHNKTPTQENNSDKKLSGNFEINLQKKKIFPKSGNY